MNNNLKKVISSAAAFAIVASSATALAATPFPDVDESASYANAVEILYGLGVVSGDDNGLFNPDNNVTRAEFSKMVVESIGEGAAAAGQKAPQYSDVNGHWGEGYVAAASGKGIINGFEDGTFKPDEQVTYAQAVKMLVCAAGYETYAVKNGGWPSGYLAWGNQLKIINGVSVESNDTALTRKDCAVLVANALKAPLCVIDRYEPSGITGELAPILEIRDDYKNSKYQTLLSEQHDAYVVKGRVTATSQSNSGLENDEVKFDVESAERYDDEYDIKGSTAITDVTMKVGTTNASSLLFTYAEAIVQKDTDSDEWTIIAITPYGTNKTVEFAADDVDEDDTDLPNKLAVKKGANTSATTKYDLDANVKVYVNGIHVTDDLADAVDKYIYKNSTGVVTLVDATKVGSTSTDGKYDYIMVDYYVDAVVDQVTTTSSNIRVSFKANDTTAMGSTNRMQWDPDDEDMDVTFTKDGKEISYTDLAEYDVISIAYDVTGAFKDSEYYDVLVASNKVEGTVTSKDDDVEENTVTIDGQDYECVLSMVSVASDIELNTTYALYLNAFGKVAYIDEASTDKNYGVIVGMYTSAGNDYATVRMITANAEVVAYECKDSTAEADFYNVLKAAGVERASGDAYAGQTISKGNIGKDKVKNCVVEYQLSGGKVKLKDKKAGNGGNALEFKAANNKLGSFAINEAVTKMIDMDSYMSDTNNGSTVGTLSLASFEDEATYEAWAFDKNNNGDYRFIIVLSGTSSLRAKTAIAVVEKNASTADLDGTECWTTTVAINGAEKTTLNVEKTAVASLSEGDVIVYTVGPDGYVENGNLYKLASKANNYETQLTNTYADAKFSTVLGSVIDANNDVTYGTDAATADVQLYFGVVYTKSASNLDLAIAKTGNQSDINDDAEVKNFSIGGANAYTFNYDGGKNAKVSVGAAGNTTRSAWNSYRVETADGGEYIDWSAVTDDIADGGFQPTLALVKVVEDDVTDIVYYVAE